VREAVFSDQVFREDFPLLLVNGMKKGLEKERQ